jgi:hypothetical protein
MFSVFFEKFLPVQPTYALLQSEQVKLYLSLAKYLLVVLAFNFRFCSMELFVL